MNKLRISIIDTGCRVILSRYHDIEIDPRSIEELYELTVESASSTAQMLSNDLNWGNRQKPAEEGPG